MFICTDFECRSNPLVILRFIPWLWNTMVHDAIHTPHHDFRHVVITSGKDTLSQGRKKGVQRLIVICVNAFISGNGINSNYVWHLKFDIIHFLGYISGVRNLPCLLGNEVNDDRDGNFEIHVVVNLFVIYTIEQRAFSALLPTTVDTELVG